MIVVDISCPYIDGEETVREIKRAVPWAAVVALTMCDDRGYCDQLLSAGADESMLIWESRAELPFMIRAILARDSQMQERNKDV
jgi:DNA-binding NarL/FixJ family response regulator